MVNEILTREVFFRCRALDHILVTQVPMHIDLSRHDRFTSQVDVSRTCGHRNLALPSDRGELVILDNKGGVFDGRAAVARDEHRSFENGRVARSRLASHRRRTSCCRCQQERRDEEMSERFGNHRTCTFTILDCGRYAGIHTVGRAAVLSTVRSRISYADGVKNSVDCPVFISIR